MNGISAKIKDANMFSDSLETEKLNRFFSRLFPIDGQIAVSFSEFSGDPGVGWSFPTSKISPRKADTPTLADQLLNLDVQNAYVQLATHGFSYQKSYGANTAKMVNAIMVDIDNFPLAEYSDKLKAIKESFPFLNELPPTYIVDTGRKGFQAYWLFGWDTKINKARNELFAARALLTAILGGDRACEARVQSSRIPYMKRPDGNTPEIIFESRKNYNFKPFLGRLFYLCKDYIVDWDGQARHKDEESLFEDDIQCSLVDYYSIRLDFSIAEKFRYSFSRDSITVDYTEQLDSVKEWYAAHAADKDAKDKKEDTVRATKRVYTKTLSHFAKRKFDLENLLRTTKGNLTGYRNCFLYIYGSNEAYMCKEKETVKKTLYNANERFSEPLPIAEVETIFRSISRKRRNYSDIRVGEILPMNRLADPLLIYDPIKKKKAEDKEKLALKTKREKEKRRKAQQFAHKFVVAAASEKNISMLARIMNISRPTAYKYKRIFNAVIERLKKSAEQKSCGEINSNPLMAPENEGFVYAIVNST